MSVNNTESLLHCVRCVTARSGTAVTRLLDGASPLRKLYFSFSFSLPRFNVYVISTCTQNGNNRAVICFYKCKRFVQSATCLPLSQLVSSTVLCAVLAAFCIYGLSPFIESK